MGFRKTVFVDTSALIAFVAEYDPAHEVVENAFFTADKSGWELLTTDYVLDEFMTWLRCREKLEFEKISLFFNTFFDGGIQLINVEKRLIGPSLEIISRYKDQYFSFTDCVSFSVMKDRKIKDVLTTDKHFTIAGFSALI